MSTKFKGQVGIVGFGYIGSVIGTVLAEQGYLVCGVDTNDEIIHQINRGTCPFNEPGLEPLMVSMIENERLLVSNDVSILRNCETVIVTVGTPLTDKYRADITHIEEAITSIRPFLQNEVLVMIKSTIPPYTTSHLIAPLLKEVDGVKLAFSPERLAEGNAIKELKSIPIVVGGVDEKSTKCASTFWRESLAVEVIEVSDSTTAEMVKLSDNLWIDLNIALASELALLSDQLKIDVLEVIKAANSLPKGGNGQRVNILTPSVGVGGYCLTKDPWFVQQLGEDYGLDLHLPKIGRNVNDSMPLYSARMIDSLLKEKFDDPSLVKISILGIAFKNNTGDCRFTPTKPVIEELSNLHYNLAICDPYTTQHDETLVTQLPVSKNIEETLFGADCVAFLTGHDAFRNLPLESIAELVNGEALIFDGRMFFTKDQIKDMNRLGLRYKGVGR